MRKKPNDAAAEKVAILLVSGLPVAEAETACVEKLGVKPEAVPTVMKAARRKLLLAAEVDRATETGHSLTRLRDLYGRAVKAQDTRTAAVIVKEINKLCGLYPPSAGAAAQTPPAADGSAAELDAIRAHLLPLALAPEEYPLREHARVAAETIRTLQSRTDHAKDH